jgi:predicted HD phosphohydrolase
MSVPSAFDAISQLYARHGASDYVGEKVSQLEHMLQCAKFANDSGADDDVVIGALLHGIA